MNALQRVNTKSIISQKLRIAQEKSFTWKSITRSILIFPENLAAFEENLIFWAHFWTFWTPITRKLKIGKTWYMVFLSFQHIAHLLCKDGHFWVRGREALYILSWEKSECWNSINKSVDCFKLWYPPSPAWNSKIWIYYLILINFWLKI